MLHARNLKIIEQKASAPKVSGSDYSERHKNPNKAETRLFVLSVLMIMGLAFGSIGLLLKEDFNRCYLLLRFERERYSLPE